MWCGRAWCWGWRRSRFAPSVGVLYVLLVAQTLCSAVFEPARNALFPDIVRPEELTAANAVSSASWSLMLAVGSAAGGFVTDVLGWQWALVLDAATYVVSAVFLLRIREPAVTRSPRAGDVYDWLGIRDLFAGAQWMLSRPRVWSLALLKPLWQLGGARSLVLTLLGETAFVAAGWPFLSVSALYVARGMGTGLGPVLGRWLTRSEPAAMERAILVSLALAGVCYVLLGFASSLPLALSLILVGHLGGATVWVFSTIRLQQLTPSEVRGRVFSAEHSAFTLVMGLTTGVFGRIDDVWGATLGTWLAPLGCRQ